MAYENIRINNPNFSVGPQAGTYCSVDNLVNPVVMHVKNELGTLLRTFSFHPNTILQNGPYVYDEDSLLNSDGYYYNEFVSLKYTGPRDQTSYFNGAVFYTLEKRAQVIRAYYTYELEDENDPYSSYKVDGDDNLLTDYRVEYSSNIIRRWKLDEANATLVLDKTFIKNSDEVDWFDANAFAIQHRVFELIDHSANGSGVIEITTTSGLKKYDTLLIGPSGDVDTLGKVEEVYVHNIVDGNTIEIRTYDGYIPPLYDYVVGDSVTTFNDILLFSNSTPLINDENIAFGYLSTSGTLYNIDQVNYGEVTNRNYSGIFSDITCAVWNKEFDTLSFPKGSNLLHLSLNDYTVIKSQNLALYYKYLYDNIKLYDIDIKDTTIYRLQKEIIKRDDTGLYALMTWFTYNLHNDSLAPYTSSVTLISTNNVSVITTRSFITVIVRDQFGIGLINRNVYFTKTGDTGAVMTPLDGYKITDSNGLATIQYDAGNFFEGTVLIEANVDGSNITHGSSFVLSHISLTQYNKYESTILLHSIPYTEYHCSILSKAHLLRETNDVGQLLSVYDGGMFVVPKADYIYPKNLLMNENSWTEYRERPALLFQIFEPTLHKIDDQSESGIANIKIFMTKLLFSKNSVLPNTETLQDYVYHNLLVTGGQSENEYPISQNFVSRHLTYGHIAAASLDQFVFIQEARPAMWSEKNNVDTDYWIRLRPFANSLDPDTLVIKFREHSYLGEGTWVDVTSLGTITLYDAGGGLLGIDFYYVPLTPFHHNATVYVYIEVYDIALIPNIIIVDYWFKLIQDYKSPYIENHYPSIEEFNVPVNTEIKFDLLDTGEGVNISTLEVFVNNRNVTFTYDEYEHGNYHIYCTLDRVFHYGEVVYVVVDVLDRSDNNNRLFDGWYFYCSESEGPWIDMTNTVPALCLDGKDRNQTVSAQVYGINDTGIEYDSIKVEVGGKYRNIKITPIVYRLS